MNEEEKKAIEYLKTRLYGNEDCKYIDVAQEDLRIFINLVDSLQKENEELKEERQIVGIPVRNKRDGRIGIVLHQWESGNVAVLESINPRVINTHDSWNTLEIVTDEVKQTQTKCETILVQKIKDKIEEILNNGEYIIIFEGDADFPDEATRIDAQKYIKLEKLQELLEGRK